MVDDKSYYRYYQLKPIQVDEEHRQDNGSLQADVVALFVNGQGVY